MARYTINQIADYMIDFAHQSESFISNLKLQKLLYYAQSWHLALNDEPLFDGEFEAWVHGPVNPSVYQRFKKYSFKSIDEDVQAPEIDPKTLDFLGELMREYFPLDAYELELLTHQEAPWKDARQGLPTSLPSNNVIAQDSMRDYYRQQAK